MTEAAKALRALHVPGSPLVVPNAWDVSSARVFAEAGHPVVGTPTGAGAAAVQLAVDDDAHADATTESDREEVVEPAADAAMPLIRLEGITKVFESEDKDGK